MNWQKIVSATVISILILVSAYLIDYVTKHTFPILIGYMAGSLYMSLYIYLTKKNHERHTKHIQ